MTPQQVRIAARLLVVYLINELKQNKIDIYIDIEKFEGRLTTEEGEDIMDEMVEIGEQILGDTLRIGTVTEIIHFAKHS